MKPNDFDTNILEKTFENIFNTHAYSFIPCAIHDRTYFHSRHYTNRWASVFR